MADPAGPTPEDYERERAERIAANRQRMAALGLQELALDMKKSNAAFANPAKRGHVRKPRVLSSAEPRRTSNRVQASGLIERVVGISCQRKGRLRCTMRALTCH